MKSSILFIVYSLLTLLFAIATWAVINVGLGYYLQLQNVPPLVIFIVLLLLNVAGLSTGICLSCWQMKKIRLVYKSSTHLLSLLTTTAATVLPFSIGYALFKKKPAPVQLLSSYKPPAHSWLSTLANEALMVIGGRWLNTLLKHHHNSSKDQS